MDILWRLTWALPLVLVIGIVAVLVLKRFAVPAQRASQAATRMSVRETLSLSDDTRVHLIEIDRRDYLVVESARHTVLQSALPQVSETTRSPTRFTPPWMQRLCRVGGR